MVRFYKTAIYLHGSDIQICTLFADEMQAQLQCDVSVYPASDRGNTCATELVICRAITSLYSGHSTILNHININQSERSLISEFTLS